MASIGPGPVNLEAMDFSPKELLVELPIHQANQPANLIIAGDSVVVEYVGASPYTVQSCIAICRGHPWGAKQELPFDHIINCTVDSSALSPNTAPSVVLTAVSPQSQKLLTFRGTLPSTKDVNKAEAWTEQVIRKAYKGVPRHRRLLALVNPFGGQGKGATIWQKVVLPIFEAAGCHVESIMTERRYHATEIGETLDVEAHDAVVCISGDGLIHELINGIGKRPDAGRLLRKLRIGVVPAGSGNAIAVNLLGPKNSANPALGALNVLKGHSLPLDLCSVTQTAPSSDPSTAPRVVRTLSALSQSFGLMADVDVGTEHLRWMGGTRFVVGYLHGVLTGRKQRCKLEVQVVKQDKDEIGKWWAEERRKIREKKERRDERDLATPRSDSPVADDDAEPSGLPPLQFGDVATPLCVEQGAPDGGSGGWLTIEDELTSVYAGTAPFVADMLLQFPAKIGGDGCVDVVVHNSPSLSRSLASVDGAELGSAFRNPDVRYYKAKAFRLTPLPSKKPSSIVVDGELFPYQPVQVEVHSGLTNVLSMGATVGEIGSPETI